MPFWRRRSAREAPSSTPDGPVPPPADVPPAPADLDGVRERLQGSGVDVTGLTLVGSAGPLPVCGWDLPDGSGALDRWRALRGLHRSTGLWPVLLGPRDELSDAFSFAGGEHEDDALEDGMRAEPAEVLARLVRAVEGDRDSPVRDRPRLPRSMDVPPEQLAVVQGPTLLALVPAAAGWQVPGLVSWEGGANVDLPPADHVAVLRSWEHRFGAELVALTNDTVELVVRQPPTSPAEVVAVAREMYAYCPDTVDQGAGTLEALCLEMVVARSWSFWWD